MNNEENSPANKELPFFSYGFFRPGEISFLGIKDFVKNSKKFEITGELWLRDGITLYKESDHGNVEGYLIYFKPELANEAYSFINNLEPKKLFKWKENNMREINFNILYGIKPDRGSEKLKDTNWRTIWDDLLFTTAMELLEELPNDNLISDLKPLIKLQMKYMLLWTILERFTFLRYSFGGNPTKRINLLSENDYFKEALNLFVNSEREIYSSEDPGIRITLSKENSKKSINYYYQVRSNITHRGKAVVRDYETVLFSFNELFKITKYILEKTKLECEEIKQKFDFDNY